MEQNWTTFAIEAANFLVLVWILKRFLYRPVLNVIARRRAAIEAALAEARTRHTEAEALEARYRDRLSAWERERQQALDELNAEIAAERARRLEALEADLAEERKKAEVLEERRRAEEWRRREAEAVATGLAFTARLLGRLAGPDLEARLVRMAVEDLDALPAADRKALGEAVADTDGAAVVTTAYPLPETLRKALTEALAALVGKRGADCVFREDPGLVAGVEVSVGPWVLKASVRDELEFFGGTAGAAD